MRQARREATIIDVPGWVPSGLHRGYRVIAEESGEEDAAAWARRMKGGGITAAPAPSAARKPVTVPIWVPAEHRARYQLIAAEQGEEEAAAWARRVMADAKPAAVTAKLEGKAEPVRPDWRSPENVEVVRRMWADGASATEIAIEIANGASRHSVNGVVRRLEMKRGVPPAPAQPTRTKALPAPPPPRPTATSGAAQMPAPLHLDGGIEIFDLRECHCRWPVSGSGVAMRYCGLPRPDPKRPYCDGHEQVARGGKAATDALRKIAEAERPDAG